MATTLYLVSAETPEGEGYWKIGITKWANPIKRDPQRYREVFRAVPLGLNQARFVESQLSKAFGKIGFFIGVEALPHAASLEAVCELFDQLVAWESSGLAEVWPELTADESEERVRFCVYGSDDAYSAEAEAHVSDMRPAWTRCEQLVAAVSKSIEAAKSARGIHSTREPMWA